MLLKATGDYRRLLAESAAADRDRVEKLEALRKAQLREQARRAHEEKAQRQRQAEDRVRAVQEAKEAAVRAEREKVAKLVAEKEAAERKARVLSVDEAKERRAKIERARLGPQGRNTSKVSLQRRTTPSHLYGTGSAAPSPVKSMGTGTTGARTPVKGLPARKQTQGGAPPIEDARPLVRMSGGKKGKPIATAKQAGRGHADLNGLPPLQALQKNGKRDLRTIEEIQNDLWRKQGKDLPYLKQQPRKTATKERMKPNTMPKKALPKLGASKQNQSRQPTQPDRRQARYEAEDESDEDSFIASEEEDEPSYGHGSSKQDRNDVSSQIWQLFGKRKADYVSRDIESDDDMEAHASDIEREERRAAKAAREEDAAEERALKLAEERKRRRREGH